MLSMANKWNVHISFIRMCFEMLNRKASFETADKNNLSKVSDIQRKRLDSASQFIVFIIVAVYGRQEYLPAIHRPKQGH